MEQKKKNDIYIFFIVVLSVLFVGLVLLVLSGWFYKDNTPSQTSLVPGESAVMHINGTEAVVLSYNFDGSFLAGESIKQSISLRNDSEKNLYLRAKMTIFTGNNNDPNIAMITAQNWTMADDGYYYFDGTIEGLNTVGFISGFKINEGEQLASSSNYIVVVTVEGLSSEFDRNSVWGM